MMEWKFEQNENEAYNPRKKACIFNRIVSQRIHDTDIISLR